MINKSFSQIKNPSVISNIFLILFICNPLFAQEKKKDLQDTKKFTNGKIEDHFKTQLDDIGRRNVVTLNSFCSGFFINTNTIITNKHCVKQLDLSKKCYFKTKDSQQINIKNTCQVVKESEYYDIAILKTQNHYSYVKTLTTGDFKDSSYLYSISYPNGQYSINKLKLRNFEYSSEFNKKIGILDSLHELPKEERSNLVVIDPDDIFMEGSIYDKYLIQGGSSGGLLINARLELVGMISGSALGKMLSKKELNDIYKKELLFGNEWALEFSRTAIRNNLNHKQIVHFLSSMQKIRKENENWDSDKLVQALEGVPVEVFVGLLHLSSELHKALHDLAEFSKDFHRSRSIVVGVPASKISSLLNE